MMIIREVLEHAHVLRRLYGEDKRFGRFVYASDNVDIKVGQGAKDRGVFHL